MEDLAIRVNEEEQTISARDLHEKLKIGTEFRKWFPRMCEYGFEEHTDFERVSQKCPTLGGDQTMTDYQMTIQMAKEICMIQRTPEGKAVRQYLLKIEEAWNSPEQVMSRALKIANKTIENFKLQIKDMQPKVEFFDAVADSKTAIPMKEVAAVLAVKGFGRNNLFEFLRDRKILDKNNTPNRRYIDMAWFRTIEQKYTKPDGEVCINIKTLVYQKGIDGIRKLIEEAR